MMGIRPAVLISPVIGLLAAPVMLIVAMAVWLSLGRPIFFHQTRVGLDGTSFGIIKFRTMRDLRDEGGQPLPDEARMCAVGRFLRYTRLDELPEILNILKGEMNFVGPRPLLPSTIAAFGKQGELRSTVRPGLTGWAQVNGNTLLTAEEKLQLDLWYVSNHNLWLDAIILIRTLGVISRGEKRHLRNLEEAFANSSDRRC